MLGSSSAAGANDGLIVSCERKSVSAATLSHGGGRMLARFCRLRRRASQRGRSAGRGGRRGGVVHCGFFFQLGFVFFFHILIE